MDQQTKAALKQDKFVATTTHSLEWASENSRSVIATGLLVLGLIVFVVAGVLIYNSRSDAASVAFGAAMQTYQTPVTQSGEPTPAGAKTGSSGRSTTRQSSGSWTTIRWRRRPMHTTRGCAGSRIDSM